MGRSVSVSRRGLSTSKNAGISSDKTGGNPVHRKPKVSAARLVRCGSAGPKARARAVVDGCQVHIPEPGVEAKLAGTLLDDLPRLLVCRAEPSGEAQEGVRGPRKADQVRHVRPYRKPTQVGR